MLDLVFLKQIFNAGRQPVDSLALGGHHFPQIKANLACQPHAFKMGVRRLEHFRAVQQSFGRNTPNIQTRTAKRFARLDTGNFQAKLPCANSAVIAARAAANDDKVVNICHEKLRLLELISKRAALINQQR